MSTIDNRFDACEICASLAWRELYRGPVRDGAFPKLSDPDTIVALCGICGSARLEESRAQQAAIYQDASYRTLVGEQASPENFYAAHDNLQMQNLAVLWPESLRGKVVADLGCAAGSFLDHIRGIAMRGVAIEPCEAYHASLAANGYDVYACATAALERWQGKVDHAFSFSVIEHVTDPRQFLCEMRELLVPGGRALISTPNRNDVLLNLLPSDYPAFFYRTVHRWYFEAESLKTCAAAAGLIPLATRYVQRFGLSNAIKWLRDRQPGGGDSLVELQSPLLDGVWKNYLEDRGTADYLYMTLERPK